MAHHTNTAQPHASTQIARYPSVIPCATARVVSSRFYRACDASLSTPSRATPQHQRVNTATRLRPSSVPKSRAATQFERAGASGTNGHAFACELVEVMSGGSQPLPSELKANAVRSRRDSAERRAPNCSGPAHGEHPVVNGKAGVLSAQGSTPPSSTNFPQQTSPSQQGEKP